jgi:type IV pilus assembly protein PilM
LQERFKEARVFNFIRTGNLVGLDIGSSSIKAVQFKTTGDQLTLLNLALEDIPLEIQEEADLDIKNDMLADIIRKLFKEHNIKSKDVVTSLPGDDAIVRYVKLPFMSDEELKNVISYEAEQYIPLAIDQVVLDFDRLGEIDEDGQKKIEVLLVAAKEEIVDRHLELIRRVGLNPAVIDVDSFALSNAFIRNYSNVEGETVSLIHVGAKLTTINIVEEGISHLTRDVQVAGNSFSREIQREFGMSLAEADELKRTQGKVLTETEDIMQIEVPTQEDKSARVGEALNPLLNKLIAEIRRSFSYYESSIRKKPVSRIILSGGSSRLKNFDKYLAEKLNVPVDLNDPFKTVEISERFFDVDFIKANAQRFNVGVGLALRQVD